MPYAPTRSRAARDAATVLTVALIALGACTTSGTSKAPSNLPAPDPETDSAAVVRYGRYTLVELTPENAQENLMEQVIDVALPPAIPATVADTLRYVLLRSGYRLCETNEATSDFERMSLPASHYHLGPLPLREALNVLIGPAWQFDTDEAAREVCFTRRMLTLPKPGATNSPAGVERRS